MRRITSSRPAALAGVLLATAVRMVHVTAVRSVSPSRWTMSPHDEPLPHLAVYRPSGPLFFAAAHKLREALSILDGVKVVLLRLSGIAAVDASAALAAVGAFSLVGERVHATASEAIAAISQ